MVTICLVGYYLYYVDKETMEYTPLCNKPNCLHQKETDPMKVTNCNAMVRTGKLFYLCLNYCIETFVYCCNGNID